MSLRLAELENIELEVADLKRDLCFSQARVAVGSKHYKELEGFKKRVRVVELQLKADLKKARSKTS